ALLMGVVVIGQNGNKGGFTTENLDRSANACQDFYQFATGGWQKANPVPGAFGRWGSFNILAEHNRDALRTILDAAEKNPKAARGSNEQKIGDFYASCMSEAQIEAAGMQPIMPELKAIDKIKDLRSLQAEVARLHSYGVGAMFGFGSLQDAKNSKMVIAVAVQGGLGLPDRDFYTDDSDKMKETRAEYVKHMTNMFQLMGEDAAKAAADANTVMMIETKLARASMTNVEQRDPIKTYNKMTIAQLRELNKNLWWESYFADIKQPGITELNVMQPDFFRALDKELTATSLDDWKTYLRWQLLTTYAPTLSSKFDTENFNFFSKYLNGTKEQLPRWRRCVAATDGSIGEALGEVYVQKNFTPDAKQRMQTMVRNLIAALRDDLQTIQWMGDETRQQALTKLDAIAQKIGYPDRWRNYTALKIDRKSYAGNTMQANVFEFNRQLNEINKEVDRGQWIMTPPTVNAYYQPLRNEIVFPAGILQPPFFDFSADDALNYGAIGAVIGHEMTHGFDDRGRQYDAEGNLRVWWTPDDLKNYQARATCVENQFSGFKVEEGLFQKGKLVLGESIADLGGLKIAYRAFQKSLEGKPRPKDIDGFTPEQRFFLGWAQVWATNYRAEAARQQALTDSHPLSRFRVNGPLSNLPEFAQAYQCKDGDPMVRPTTDRCEIW
ncbi:MAG: M13 family metallopeptidase, partial [Acidobacteria bacterium]|nr:M13 family metallopeptidase [Acidobacteriota bacterium]